MNKKLLLSVLLLVYSSMTALAQEWQWSVPVYGQKGLVRAFLWIPNNCSYVRGVVVAQHNMEEISILLNPSFRKTMAEIGFAEVWVSPSFNHLFNFKQGAGELFNAFMDSLAVVSGYAELQYAPVVGLGHSAAASWPYYFAAWNPGHTLACVSVSGQWPYARNQFAPDIWSADQNIDYIPSLETMGEYEAAATFSAEGLKERQEHPHMPLSMLAVPAEGHFATSQHKTEFIAYYIKKAAQYRLPKNDQQKGAPVLTPIDPVKTGWLADKWRFDASPAAPAAPVGKYTGNTTEAFWYFDEDMVRRVEAYGALYKGLRPQLIGFVQEGKMAPQKSTHLQIDLQFLPKADGVTFNLQGAFYDTVGDGSPRLSMWSGLPAGSPIGHATGGGPITIDWVAGPFKKINDNTFALQLGPGLEANPKTFTGTFIASHPGDAQYKPIVQQAQMIIPARLTEGKEQHIDFPPISDQRAGVKSIPLNAVSDAGVPVYYYLLEGPATITGNTLSFTQIPPKAKYPVKVTVVAWQYGRSSEPKLQSAEPVTRSFYIINANAFIHPGIMHSREDLERMKKAVANKEEPIYAGYQVFIQNPASQFDYKMQGPLPMVGRNPTVGQTIYDSDANAAHQNAVMWAITGDQRYANKAIEIINAWSSTLQSITGRDAVLMAGLGPFKMVNAAEIIRYTNAGWSTADIQQTEKHFREVIYPVIKDFAPFANGNWDAAAIKTVMAIGVFCNDRNIYEKALRYYVNGSGNGRLTYYVINEEGQVQESGRDQPHTQLGIALLSDACEIAWHQGIDLYGYANNRLLKGFEYTAKYNLGNEVPFTHVLDRTGKYEHFKPSIKGRGELRAVYEQVYNHYVNRMGLQTPYTAQAAAKIRPEGPGRPGADHPGYGTLYYTRPAGSAIIKNLSVPPAAPGALIANGTDAAIALTWVASIGGDTYTVKRATKSGGPYTVIAKDVTHTIYADKQVKPGTIYYYTVSASNAKGESGDACETGIAAGLPAPWKQQDIGKVKIAGHTNYNGDVHTMEGFGSGPISTKDTCHFVYMPLQGDGMITVRLHPEPSSQFSRTGLMMRESIADNAAHASVLLFPGQSGSIEAPSWHLRLLTRTTTGASTTIEAMGHALIGPAVTYGRLTGFYWLRLKRSGNTFTGYGSYDGKEWTAIGSVTVSLKKNLLVGIPVASGINNSTVVQFDQLTVSR